MIQENVLFYLLTVLEVQFLSQLNIIKLIKKLLKIQSISINRNVIVCINMSILKYSNDFFELFLADNRIKIKLIWENMERRGAGAWFQFPSGFVL